MRKLVLFTFISVTLFNICIAQELKSPDGKFVMSFSLLENGTPSYTLVYKGKVVIKPGKLGLELKSDAQKPVSNDADMVQKSMNAKVSLFDNFIIAGTKTAMFDESWNPVWGEVKTIRNHYNEMAVTPDQKK
ncbi:MAG: glycoside hydrolase family 97 N-terminal domain-containing protein [Ginsengibacter sp.]